MRVGIAFEQRAARATGSRAGSLTVNFSRIGAGSLGDEQFWFFGPLGPAEGKLGGIHPGGRSGPALPDALRSNYTRDVEISYRKSMAVSARMCGISGGQHSVLGSCAGSRPCWIGAPGD